MPLRIIKEDITKLTCGAIVNPTDSWYSGSGGTDYAVHTAAGEELDLACAELKLLDTGDVRVTRGYGLPCGYIIHTVGPVWVGGEAHEPILLRSCYLNALLKAEELGLDSVAFPLISSGTFGFPKDQVLRIAVEAIQSFLFAMESDLEVCICIPDRRAYELSRAEELKDFLSGRGGAGRVKKKAAPEERRICAPMQTFAAVTADADECDSISDWLKTQDDTFAVTLLKLIDKKGMTEVECYKKANVSRKTFYKINNDPDYRPSKPTVLAFAIALKLTLEETEQLLRTVGFSLSHSSRADLIIEFYIRHGSYDISEINAALFQYDQPCLGC